MMQSERSPSPRSCLWLLFTAVAILCAGDAREAGATRSPARAEFYVAVDGSDDGPGTRDRPWATINHAADVVEAGARVIVRGGHYALRSQVRPEAFRSARGMDRFCRLSRRKRRARCGGAAAAVADGTQQRRGADRGCLVHSCSQFDRYQFARCRFTIRDSSNVDLINNTTRGTFSSGIAVWDTGHKRTTTKNIRILANTVTRANTWDLAPPDELDATRAAA